MGVDIAGMVISAAVKAADTVTVRIQMSPVVRSTLLRLPFEYVSSLRPNYNFRIVEFRPCASNNNGAQG